MAVTILIELDDIRLCIASAFVIAFPTVFTKEDVIITYAGGTQEKLVWGIFKRKLSAHFHSYHRVGKYHDEGWALYTCCSCFDSIDRLTAVLGASNDASVGTKGTYVARCNEQGRIAESEEDSFKRIFEFFYPVLRSRLEKSKEHYNGIASHLVTWKEDLKRNEGAARDVHDRCTAMNTGSHYYYGQDHPGAQPGAIHGQDDSDAPLTTSPRHTREGRGANHSQDHSIARLTIRHGQDDSDAHTRANNGQEDRGAQPRPISHPFLGVEHVLLSEGSVNGGSM